MRKLLKHIVTKTFLYKIYLRYIYKIKPYQSAVIELTDKCNLECSYCPKGYGVGIGNSFLDIEKFKIIFDKLNKDLKLKKLILVGFGEPLLYKDMVKAIKYCNEKRPGILTYLTTNGILYTPNLALQLSEAGLSQITVSLNFTDEELYLKYNRSNFFERVFANLEEISKLNNIKTRIIVQILDLPENKDKLEEYKDIIENKWGFEFQLQPFVSWGGQIDIPEKNRNLKKINDKNRYPCAQIERSLIVQTDGSVRVCCIAMPINAKHLTIGNLLTEDTPNDLIKSDKLRELKRLNMQNCLSNLPVCNTCDAWKNIPNFYFKFNNRWY